MEGERAVEDEQPGLREMGRLGLSARMKRDTLQVPREAPTSREQELFLQPKKTNSYFLKKLKLMTGQEKVFYSF